MPFDFAKARQNLQAFDLKKLFRENLGWDNPGPDLRVSYDGNSLRLAGVAQKHGFGVYLCVFEEGGIPDYATRRKIEAQVRMSAHEHLIIFTNREHTRQIWQWVRREAGKPTTSREFEVHQGQSGEALLQRLQSMVFELEEEEELVGIIPTLGRVRAAFDLERVTRRFYDRFKDEHNAFLRFLHGIPDEEMQRWYVSVTLNRLMFVYFIQKKGFLDGDEDYLRTKMLETQFRKGHDEFYREFLCPLFFEGFAKRESERSGEINATLGKIPYLNGGIFQRHQIEEMHGRAIQIPDAAFEQLFDFFDQYRWNLDERPLRNDNEINPDVLGYIFEKYINQKQMGAYYTKEDITGYISKYTVLPWLLDQAQKECRIAFEGNSAVWMLLQTDPDRYIYPAVRRGVIADDGTIIPETALPDFVQAGMKDAKARMFDRRYNLQEANLQDKKGEKLTLPSETWREYVDRRRRCLELRQKLVQGEIHEVNDLITCNLDIQQFAQDVVETSEGPELLRAFWKGLTRIKVLDPTCGSGAFLFATLNILEPLYEACLERMRIFLQELEQSGEKHRPEKFSDFRETLEQVDRHTNPRYYILKSIIVNNLYGVDIMEEAVEICKLRLFLKLVAQAERAEKIEPLPDIDFNIRAGNTLVGFTSIEEVRQSFSSDGQQMRMLFPEEEALIQRIEEESAIASSAFMQFQLQQVEKGSVTAEDKAALRQRLENLNAILNRALAKGYGVNADSLDFTPWLKSHKPFHWLTDFYGIMTNGGFDVIIGNPPYVEYTKVKEDYKVINYKTEKCGNLYAYIMERSLNLLSEIISRSGFIVLVGSMCTERMESLQSFYTSKCNLLHLSTYSGHTCPGVLFEGVANRYAIWLSQAGKSRLEIFSSKYLKWYSSERGYLFSNIHYHTVASFQDSTAYKIDNTLGIQVIEKLQKQKTTLVSSLMSSGVIYIYTTPIHWVKAFTFIPFFKGNGKKISTQIKGLSVKNDAKSAIVCILNSSLFFYWWITRSDCYHLVSREIEHFPVDIKNLMEKFGNDIEILQKKLMEDLKLKSKIGQRNQKTTGLIEFQVIDPKQSKPIIDEIDRVLANQFNLTDEELDYIINYDVKYRIGAEEEE